MHFPIFSDSSPNCLWGVPGIGSIISHTCPPQKTINVYGFVYGFGVAFMVFWGARLWFFFLGGGGRLWFFGGAIMVLGEAFMVGFLGGGVYGEGVSGFRGQSVYGFRRFGGAFIVFGGSVFVVLRDGCLWFFFEGRAFMVFGGGVYGFRWRPLWVFSRVVNGFGLLEGGWFCLSAVVWG